MQKIQFFISGISSKILNKKDDKTGIPVVNTLERGDLVIMNKFVKKPIVKVR